MASFAAEGQPENARWYDFYAAGFAAWAMCVRKGRGGIGKFAGEHLIFLSRHFTSIFVKSVAAAFWDVNDLSSELIFHVVGFTIFTISFGDGSPQTTGATKPTDALLLPEF